MAIITFKKGNQNNEINFLGGEEPDKVFFANNFVDLSSDLSSDLGILSLLELDDLLDLLESYS
jgi:hypothetical protein